MNHGGLLWNIFVCFDYKIQVILHYCDRRRTDVGPKFAGDINPISKLRWADNARPIWTQSWSNVGLTHIPL